MIRRSRSSCVRFLPSCPSLRHLATTERSLASQTYAPSKPSSPKSSALLSGLSARPTTPRMDGQAVRRWSSGRKGRERRRRRG
jgi:hypothetical protein